MATNEKKMTKVNALTIALELVEKSTHADKDAVAEKIRKEIENLSKKSGAGKPTAKQTANMGLGELVVEHLRNNPTERFTVTQLMKSVEGLPAEITNQKLTALFRLDNVKPFVNRTMEKGVAYFQYAIAPTDADADAE
jgi:hypothetical protein